MFPVFKVLSVMLTYTPVFPHALSHTHRETQLQGLQWMSKTELLFRLTRSDMSLDPAPLGSGSNLQDRVILPLFLLLHNLLSHQELRVPLA